jgi:hypothetical protein
MRSIARFFQIFSSIRWQRLADDQTLVVSIVAGSAYLILGMLLLAAWVRIRFIRTVFADDVYRHIRNKSKQPQKAKRPSSPTTVVATHDARYGWRHDLPRQIGTMIQRTQAALRTISRSRIPSTS